MASEKKNVEVFVGLFLLIGLAVIGAMVITIGRVGQSLQKFYSINVEFPNAGGLVKGSDVLLAGARIGHVAEPPRLTGKSYTVTVQLNIRDAVKIPRKSTFLVGSSGLLGDRFVDVIPEENFDPNDVRSPGETISGTRATGLDDLTLKGGVVMDQLGAELDAIKKMTASINEQLLAEKNLKNLETTFENLRILTNNFTESSKKLDAVLDSAQGAVDSAKGTIKTADGAAGELRSAIADFRKVAEGASKTIDSAKAFADSGQSLLKQAREGNGALGTLISDRETAENLKALIINLRRSGVLFYKNRPLPQSESGPRRKP
jgi:ABC-type transporter Mla subunit MlaD